VTGSKWDCFNWSWRDFISSSRGATIDRSNSASSWA